jgi:HEAT repeat protein
MPIRKKLRRLVKKSKAIASRLTSRPPPPDPADLDDILGSKNIRAIVGLLKGRLAPATRARIATCLGKRVAQARDRIGIPYPLSPEVLKTALDALWKNNRQRALKAAVARLSKAGSCRNTAALFLIESGADGVKCLVEFLLHRMDDSDWTKHLVDLLAERQFNSALSACRDCFSTWLLRGLPKDLYSAAFRLSLLICKLGNREFARSDLVAWRREQCIEFLDELFRSQCLDRWDVTLLVPRLREFKWTNFLARVRQLLRHPQEDVRIAGFLLVAEQGSAKDIEPLAAAIPGFERGHGDLARWLVKLIRREGPTGPPRLQLAAKQADLIIAKLEPLLETPMENGQAAILELLSVIPSFDWRAHIKNALSSPSLDVCSAAWRILAERGEPADLPPLLSHLGSPCADDGAVKATTKIGLRELDSLKRRGVGNPHDHSVIVRGLVSLLASPAPVKPFSAIKVLTALDWPGWEDEVLELLLSGKYAPAAIQWALEVLGRSKNPAYLPAVVEQFKNEYADVRDAALGAALRLAPERRAEFAKRMLAKPDKFDVKKAWELLDGCVSEDELVRAHLTALRRGGADILEAIAKQAPSRLREAVLAALGSHNELTQLWAVQWLREHRDTAAVPELLKLALDKKGGPRLEAFESAIWINRCRLPRTELLKALGDREWRIRLAATTELAGDHDPEILEALLPLTRDEHVPIRAAAIKAVAQYDDPRVLSELVSALNDRDADVRRAAQEILNAPPGSVPIIDRARAVGGSDRPWAVLQERIEATHEWARRQGAELLGREVEVVQFRQGLGRTDARRRSSSVEIELTDTPVASLHPHGEEIMRGLIIHELGHHLCDVGVRGAWTMRGIARSEGVGDIYDILLDERMERIMRSRSAEWGLYLDQVASYAFAQNLHHVPLSEYAALVNLPPEEVLEGIRQGTLPGTVLRTRKAGQEQEVGLTDKDILSIPGALPPLTAFLSLLRCGFNPEIHPDPKVVEAVKLVPSNLKALPHSELLKLAREIGDLIGRDKQQRQRMRQLKRFIRSRYKLGRMIERLLQRLAEGGQIAKPLPRVPAKEEREGPRSSRSPMRLRRRGPKLPGGQYFNRGTEHTFPELRQDQRPSFDPSAHAKVVASIRPHIRRLRPYLERLGRREIEEFASLRGQRLDVAQARRVIYSRRPNLLVSAREVSSADTYLGILIDSSGSMAGGKIERAKAFGTLLAESAKGIRGIEGHVNAFDNDTFYLLGDFRRHTTASLRAGGGNNDSGALARAADLALASAMRRKILIMISDGSPAECTFESLKYLVDRLTRRWGIICAQVAVEKLPAIAFPHYVDLSAYPLPEAVTRFGRLIIQLTGRKKVRRA